MERQAESRATSTFLNGQYSMSPKISWPRALSGALHCVCEAAKRLVDEVFALQNQLSMHEPASPRASFRLSKSTNQAYNASTRRATMLLQSPRLNRFTNSKPENTETWGWQRHTARGLSEQAYQQVEPESGLCARAWRPSTGH